LAWTVSSDRNRWPRRCLFSLKNRWKSKGTKLWLYGGWGGVQKRLQEQDISFYYQGLENHIVCYEQCLNKFGNHEEKQRTDVQRYLQAFFFSTYFHSGKKNGNLTFWLPLIYTYIDT
jgi:hypothetical protein